MIQRKHVILFVKINKKYNGFHLVLMAKWDLEIQKLLKLHNLS